MKRSTFDLAPRGDCKWTYRFLEALQAGAVPVVYADDCEPPFSDLLPPDSYMLRIPENKSAHTDALLRGIPAAQRQQLCRQGQDILRRFSTFGGMLELVLQTLQQWQTTGRGPWKADGLEAKSGPEKVQPVLPTEERSWPTAVPTAAVRRPAVLAPDLASPALPPFADFLRREQVGQHAE